MASKNKSRGGTKRRHKGPKAYQAYLRQQVMAGFGHDASGNPTRLDTSKAMGHDLFHGYRADRKRH